MGKRLKVELKQGKMPFDNQKVGNDQLENENLMTTLGSSAIQY